MSKQRDKGTRYEKYLLPHLARIWADVDRAALKGIHDYGDFINTGGWLVEAKKWDTWSLPLWIRTVQKKLAKRNETYRPWAIVFASDKRKGMGDLVVQPLEQWVDLMEHQRQREARIEYLQDVIDREAHH